MMVSGVWYAASGQTIQFSPSTISAGNGQILTIDGTGFGATQSPGSRFVEFQKASDGGTTKLSPAVGEYISWTPTQIKVKVPSGAGSGIVTVVIGALRMNSLGTLVVNYNLINTSSEIRRHAGVNSKGGITFQYDTKFYNQTEARNSFAKSLKAWNCASGVNFTMGDPINKDINAKDGFSMIRFASNELPNGVLGRADIWTEPCGSGQNVIVEIDIVFNKDVNWNYGENAPSSLQYDFQSVVMRELGTAHNMDVVIDENDVMHHAYVALGATRRNLSAGNRAGATYQMDLNKAAAGGTCIAPMLQSFSDTCPTPFPIISSVFPMQGGAGDKITITGKNLTGATLVTFGRTSAASYIVKSDESIEAILGPGFTGEVAVQTPGGIFYAAGFNYIEDPIISAFSPTFGFTGDTITISGNHFETTQAVKFGDIAASSFKVISNQEVKAVVGDGASGNVAVTTSRSTATKAGFTFTLPVRITSLVPNEGKLGDTILINGSNFKKVTSVKFGNKAAASFTVLTENQILAVLADGNSGTVEVKTDIGTATLNGFKFYGAPGISSFNPERASIDRPVNIIGINFTTASAVSFGGEPAKSFTIVSDELITAVVGKGKSGAITVKARGGEGFRDGFTFVEILHISGIAPASATTGDTVLISGTNFKSVSSVSFGGVAARSFQVKSTELIAAVVGTGNGGSISVRTGEGVVTYEGFRFVDKPGISFYTPASAGTGKVVSINGTNFREITSVKFGGVEAGSYKVVSETFIEATVGLGSSGAISVKNIAGTAEAPGFTFVPAPTISGVTPALAGVGAVINIFGQNLSTVTAVNIGDRRASSFQVVSPVQITAIVAPGSIGSGVEVLTTGGTILFSNFRVVYPPTAGDFSPRTAIAGVEVLISGTNLGDVTGVMFGGVPASSFKILSPEQISATVAPFSKSGSVTLSNIAGSSAIIGFDFKFTLPVSNFTVLVTDLTCRNAANGIIRVTAKSPMNYTVTITRSGLVRTINFNDFTEVKNLVAGTYSVCLTIDEQPSFKQCMEVIIKQPDDLALLSKLNEADRILSLSMTGGEVYFVELNGAVERTTSDQINLNLVLGENKVRVYTDKLCQGVIEKTFEIGRGVQIFPNPFDNVLNIILGTQYSGNVKVEVRNIQGQILYSGNHTADSNPIVLNLPELVAGTYMVQVSSKDHRSVQKVLRK